MSRPDIIFYTLICKDGNGELLFPEVTITGQQDRKMFTTGSCHRQVLDMKEGHVTFVSMVHNRIGLGIKCSLFRFRKRTYVNNTTVICSVRSVSVSLLTFG